MVRALFVFTAILTVASAEVFYFADNNELFGDVKKQACNVEKVEKTFGSIASNQQEVKLTILDDQQCNNRSYCVYSSGLLPNDWTTPATYEDDVCTFDVPYTSYERFTTQLNINQNDWNADTWGKVKDQVVSLETAITEGKISCDNASGATDIEKASCETYKTRVIQAAKLLSSGYGLLFPIYYNKSADEIAVFEARFSEGLRRQKINLVTARWSDLIAAVQSFTRDPTAVEQTNVRKHVESEVLFHKEAKSLSVHVEGIDDSTKKKAYEAVARHYAVSCRYRPTKAHSAFCTTEMTEAECKTDAAKARKCGWIENHPAYETCVGAQQHASINRSATQDKASCQAAGGTWTTLIDEDEDIDFAAAEARRFTETQIGYLKTLFAPWPKDNAYPAVNEEQIKAYKRHILGGYVLDKNDNFKPPAGLTLDSPAASWSPPTLILTMVWAIAALIL